MKLIKFTHACVRVEDGDRALVIDPGVFSEAKAALDGVQAVLITHEHVDHLDPVAVNNAADADPRLRIYAPASVAAQLTRLGEQVVTVEVGTGFEAAGFSVQTFGGQHALIHPQIPVIANIGYLIDGAVYHPGDSFVVPPVPVSVCLVPLHAPWSKTAEVADFASAVRAPKALPVHDSLLTPVATNLVEGMVTNLAGRYGVEFSHWSPYDTLDV